MPTQTRPREHEQLDALKAELEKRGHAAEPVQNSPTHQLNVWRNGEGRQPTATVLLDGEGWAWGHQWEHALPASTPAVRVAHELERTWPR